MTITVAVHQPNFLPWIGFWHKVASADCLVLYAGVQFDKSDYTHRARLGASWLTVPVQKQPLHTAIKDIRIADVAAVHRIGATLRQVCMSKRNPNKHRLGSLVTLLESWPMDKTFLVDLTIASLMVIRDTLGIRTQFSYDGEDRGLGRTVANLDQAIQNAVPRGPRVYLSGAAAFDYMGFDSLSSVVEIRRQQLYGNPNPDTVVQLIASHDNPLEAILAAGGWQTKEGLVYASDQATLARPRPTL